MGRHKTIRDPEVWHFTPREREVLMGICRGFSYARIARDMRCSYDNVAKHAGSIRVKVGARDRFGVAETVQDAIARGDHA